MNEKKGGIGTGTPASEEWIAPMRDTPENRAIERKRDHSMQQQVEEHFQGTFLEPAAHKKPQKKCKNGITLLHSTSSEPMGASEHKSISKNCIISITMVTILFTVQNFYN